jgi:hypothetical protein
MKEMTMNRPIVCDLLSDGMSFDELFKIHGIQAKVRGDLVSLNYNMLRSAKTDMVANQCRGLILENKTWSVVAYPFDRFFNAGDSAAADIDWQTAVVQEKLDGTLCIVYYRNGKWYVGTRQDPVAVTVSTNGKTYTEMVNEACRLGFGIHDLQSMMSRLKGRVYWTSLADAKNTTFMFELTAPDNQVVCEYDKTSLTFLGARSNTSFEELGTNLGPPVPRPVYHRISRNLDSITTMVNHRDLKHEGVVIVDANYHRIKIKSDAYNFAHRCGDSMGHSWRSVVTVVLQGIDDDLRRSVPQYVRSRIDVVKNRLLQACDETDSVFRRMRNIESDSEFAMQAKREAWPHALFMLRRGKCKSCLEVAEKSRPGPIVELLRLQETGHLSISGCDDDGDDGP